MKPVFLLLTFLIILPFNIHAQHVREAFRQRMLHPRPPCAPKVIGCIAIPVGTVVAAIGGYAYLMDTPIKQGQKRGDDAFVTASLVTGGTLIVGGIVLLIADAAHHRNKRWSAIVTQENEIGLAYNF